MKKFLIAAILLCKKQQKSENRPRTPGSFNREIMNIGQRPRPIVSQLITTLSLKNILYSEIMDFNYAIITTH